MNLKEAFRFQNKLEQLLEECKNILRCESNITKVTNTYLRKKVMAEAEDETVIDKPSNEYCDHITEVAEFLIFLLDEKEKLCAAIARTKSAIDLPAGLDGEVGLNSLRRDAAAILRHMAVLRSSETVFSNGGTGYRFNNEGNQVSYKCDVKRVVTINYDRNRIRSLCTELSNRADNMSTAIDEAMINARVDYAEPFNVNDSFIEIFEDYLNTL